MVRGKLSDDIGTVGKIAFYRGFILKEPHLALQPVMMCRLIVSKGKYSAEGPARHLISPEKVKPQNHRKLSGAE